MGSRSGNRKKGNVVGVCQSGYIVVVRRVGEKDVGVKSLLKSLDKWVCIDGIVIVIVIVIRN